MSAGLSAATWCPQCGADVRVDEDGCCQGCGADAVGEGADEAHSLRKLVAAAEDRARAATGLVDALEGVLYDLVDALEGVLYDLGHDCYNAGHRTWCKPCRGIALTPPAAAEPREREYPGIVPPRWQTKPRGEEDK